MSDAWQEIQAVKSKRNSLREKLKKRKIERQVILNESINLIIPSEYFYFIIYVSNLTKYIL